MSNPIPETRSAHCREKSCETVVVFSFCFLYPSLEMALRKKNIRRKKDTSPPSHPFPRNTIKSAPKKMSWEGEEGKTAEAKKEEDEPEKSSKINFPLRFLGWGDVIRLPSLPHLL